MILHILLVLLPLALAKETYFDVLTSPRSLANLFKEFKAANKLQFAKREGRLRLRSFTKAAKFVSLQNAKASSWEVGLNKFAIMTEGEKKQYLGYNSSLISKSDKIYTETHFGVKDNLPEQVNWIDEGAVTKAKDQAKCGSCWTFGSVCSIEGAYQIATTKLKSFSEQELLHCVYELRNGCTGGLNSDAINWVRETAHLATRRNLPYIARDSTLGKCGYSKWKNGLQGAIIDSMVAVGTTEQDSIQQLTLGPLATSVDVTNNFFYYKNGILRDESCNPIRLSHAIAAVAYSPQWYLIKNSWGDDWGLEGFIKLARDHHNCGTWIHPYRPIMKLTGSEDMDEADEAATLDPNEEITTEPPTPEPCRDTYASCSKSNCVSWVWRDMCKKTCGVCQE